MTAAHPLHWPSGRPRTETAQRMNASFSEKHNNGRYVRTKPITVAGALNRLQQELERLNVHGMILSTNLELRLDGQPRSGRPDPTDPGAALYFKLKGADVVLACDRWKTVADNIAAIAKHIEALRGIERWGVGSLEQAFAGFVTLTAPNTEAAPRHWWDVLGVHRAASSTEIRTAWRNLMRTAHPDAGGSEARASELNHARDEALAEIDRNA